MSTLNEVEMVRPEDMCIGPTDCGTRHCLWGWQQTLVPRKHWGAFDCALLRLFGSDMTGYSDQGIVTRKDAADMFNMGLHAIGFTVNNPPLSKKRIAELRRKMTGEGA